MNIPDQKMHMKMLAMHHAKAMQELRAGKKETHWSWWVFPMLKGLRVSAQATRYGLNPEDVAGYYKNHALRGYLNETARTLAGMTVPLETVLGDVDAQKVVSCLTLFLPIGDAEYRANAAQVLNGKRCAYTLERTCR